jgi:hypothetical protein
MLEEKKLLLDILQSIQSIDEHLENRRIFSVYLASKTKRRAVEREIEIIGDYRMGVRMNKEIPFETVIDWTYYYPQTFNSPFEAYLIPKDIKTGERVFIEDLIEDYIGAKWNQGDTYRLESCEAIWNGTDLEIQYDPKANRSDFIG